LKNVRLVHWDEDEGLERQKQLEALGFDAAYEYDDGLMLVTKTIKSTLPDAVIIDLSRIPSHGRAVAQSIREAKYSRHIPIVFVDGEPEKVERTKQLIPDATYATWRGIKSALSKAIAKPVKNPVVPDHNLAWGTPTATKLGVKAGFKVALLASPKGFADTLKPLPAKVTFTARADGKSDLFMCFAKSARELQAHLLAIERVAARQTLWLVWPKKASGVKSDLDGNIVRNTGLAAGWVDFKVCSLDNTWSGLAFKRKKG
jgi:CheY-like chemotaxis protein